MNCISCSAPLKPGAKFCTRCGTKQHETAEVSTKETPAESAGTAQEADNISMVKQKIFWNIQPGEVARRINEAEFIKYDSAQGIIVNDGTVAYIKSGGRLIAEIHGGNYDFVSTEELNKLLETRTSGGIAGLGKGIWKTIVHLFVGQQVKEQIAGDKAAELKKLKSLDEVLEYMKRGELFSITLRQEKEFQLLMGAMHDNPDEFSDFAPMEIRTKYHDVKIGIRAFFHINDFDDFSTFYLTDENVVRTNTLAQQLTPIIRSILQECLYDVELKDARIPEEVYGRIEGRLKEVNLHGLVLKSVVEITADNEDLERMHDLARELYLSEQELDYLHRTNDFKNRLSTTVAQQQLHEAQTDLDLFKQLQEINKDGVLTKDELHRFYTVLSRERSIFDVQEADKVEAALAEIEQTGLLRKEEIDILRFQINEREYQRGFSVKLMQLKDAVEYERVRTGGEQEIQLQQMAHELELVRTKDNYAEEKFYKELQMRVATEDAGLEHARKRAQLQNDQLEFAYNLADRGQQSQMERWAQMERLDSEMEDKASERRQKEKQQELDHQLQMQKEKEATERSKIDTHQHMTQEQIMAQQVKELDAAAQAEYARSFSAGKDAEKEKEMRAEQVKFMEQQFANQQQMNMQNSDNMNKMMEKMMDTMGQVSGNMIQNRNEQKEEYRSQLQREQDRHDKHQDRALNYTTRPQQVYNAPQGNAAPPQQQPPAPQQKTTPGAAAKECSKCHRLYDADALFCEDCGCEI